MASAVASRPTEDLLGGLITVVDSIIGRHATGSASPAELAIARSCVVALLASADLGERFVSDHLSQGIPTDVDRLRRACHMYELRLWETAPEFLK